MPAQLARRSPSARDAWLVVECTLVIVATWLALGWYFDRTIEQQDASLLVAPYVKSALAAGGDWTRHLYRFGVIGGSEMHGFGGMPPHLQLAAWLGLSTTTTLNLATVIAQLVLGFFSVRLVEAVVTVWRDERCALPAAARIAIVWAAAFAPLVGWRLAVGHDNLVFGALPLCVTVSLLWSARAGTLSATALVVGALAVFEAVTGLGAQTVFYGALFGAPLVVATVLGAPRGARWGRAQWSVVAALGAGVLVALPRIVPMIAHATGGDATRGLGETVTYSFGASELRDWLGSLLWTAAPAHGDYPHELNYPLGPLVVLVIACWPRGRSRGFAWALVACIAAAVLLAVNVRPISSALLAAFVPLRAFRVPARALIPLLALVPAFALAAVWSRQPPARAARRTPGRAPWLVPWLTIACALAAIAVVRGHAALPREALAWLACAALAFAPRLVPALADRLAAWSVPAIVGIAALGVLAFDERFPRDLPHANIEAAPAQFHDALVAGSTRLETALDRVELVDPPPPYAMSTAFAAGLPAIDGVWYPPRRFLDLLSALHGTPTPSVTCVFALGHDPAFAALQQLYNVVVGVRFTDAGGEPRALPQTPGRAWFPRELERVPDGAAMTGALASAGRALADRIATTAWLLPGDHPFAVPPAACRHASVRGATTDALGGEATFDVAVDGTCTLVVPTNFTSVLHARAGDVELPVFPIDLALTGIEVPTGATRVVLAAAVEIPWWTRLAQLLGVLAHVLAAALAVQRRSASS